ncbi:MAG: FHA domain-containing protein [Eubacterium sp.]|nr:FHA domain-containing protein [Eubacterium sp.]
MDDRATIKVVDVSGDKFFSLDDIAASVGTNNIIIGTGADAHIRVENTKVSEQHGCFYKHNGMWAYRDMGSNAGSSVKGARIESTWLANGMRLVLDSRLNLDSLVIDVTIQINTGRQLLPGETPPEGYMAAYDPSPAFGGASGGAGPRMGFGGDRYGNRAPQFAGTLNLFGLFAGILWGILAVLNLVSLIKSYNSISPTMQYIGGFYTLLFWIMILGLLGTAAGCGILAFGLFTYNKDVMSKGALVLAAGYTAVVVAVLILLTELTGGLFAFIFANVEIIMMIIAIILMPVSLFSQSNNFRDHRDLSKIGSRFYRPVLFYGISLLLVIIAALSASNKYGVSIGISDLMPSSGVWVTIAWVGAVALSGVYIHIDEDPQLAARFKLGR